MMIEKVMIQLGVYFNGGHQRGTCDAEDAGRHKPTGKAEDAKSQSQKADSQKASGTGNAEDAKERNCECRGCEMKSHKSHKNPRKSHKRQKAEKPPTLKNKNNSFKKTKKILKKNWPSFVVSVGLGFLGVAVGGLVVGSGSVGLACWFGVGLQTLSWK